VRLGIISRRSVSICLLLVSLHGAVGQQIVARGTFGKPAQVLDETGEWTTPLLLASDEDVKIYIPDITNPAWLSKYYPDFKDRGIYTLSLFTFYRTPEACRTNQIRWGLGDSAHLNACITIGYRVRRAIIDPHQKSATLLYAAMVDQSGAVDSTSVQGDREFRFWNQLDENTQTALEKANKLITEQMKIYDAKIQSAR
jgi:hypothetical protein